MSAVNIIGKDGRTEAVMRVIGFEDDFLLRGELGNTLKFMTGLAFKITKSCMETCLPQQGRRSPLA